MRRFPPTVIGLIALLVLTPAEGQTPQTQVPAAQPAAPVLTGQLQKAPDCLRSGACCCWCPNDYLRKPLPCRPVPPCLGCTNDYCRKLLPCAPPPVCGGPNDYCRKPLVCARPNCEPWYSCVPSCPPAAPQAQSTAPKALANGSK